MNKLKINKNFYFIYMKKYVIFIKQVFVYNINIIILIHAIFNT